MYKSILVPFDDSETSHHALRAAVDMCTGVDGAHITVLKVVEWHDHNVETFKIATRMSGITDASVDMDAIAGIADEAEAEEAERIRKEIASIVNGFDEVSIAIINGSPHDTIVAYASDMDCDCIVMGHRGMGKLRGMLGSVAFSVLQKANKPVLVVK